VFLCIFMVNLSWVRFTIIDPSFLLLELLACLKWYLLGPWFSFICLDLIEVCLLVLQVLFHDIVLGGRISNNPNLDRFYRCI
jgi:hypothetical protein